MIQKNSKYNNLTQVNFYRKLDLNYKFKEKYKIKQCFISEFGRRKVRWELSGKHSPLKTIDNS